MIRIFLKYMQDRETDDALGLGVFCGLGCVLKVREGCVFLLSGHLCVGEVGMYRCKCLKLRALLWEVCRRESNEQVFSPVNRP